MTAPVTGPYTSTLVLKGPANMYGFKPDWLYRKRTWYRQRKPHNLPLNYTLSLYRVKSYSGADGSDYSAYTNGNNGFNQSLQSEAYNMAYAKFVGALKEEAALAVAFAERKQAMDMLTKRVTQLATFTYHLKRLDFRRAAVTLGLNPTKQMPRGLKAYSTRRDGVKGNAKRFANNYLEFHFGWSPLVMDIGHAINVLQGGVPPAYVRARGRSRTLQWVESYSTSYYWKATFSETCVCQIGAYVSVSNPNLWLANQLGFVNPATVAWELVPFSFVLDWFVNVSDVLSSFSDFWGLSLTHPRTTYMQKSGKDEYYAPRAKHTVWEALDLTRSVGPLAGPTLRLRPPWDLSPRRGLAAISLLIQRMR